MSYTLANFQRELDKLCAEAGVKAAQKRLENDDYPL